MAGEDHADRPSSANHASLNLQTELLTLCSPLDQYDKMALAVSGGSDSLAMMHIVHRWAVGCGREGDLLILCVDHGLRSAAKTEAENVMTHAKALNLSCETLVWHHENAPTSRLQERAAKARYELMADVCRARNIPCLLVAHHKEDQIETFLMRLGKGSGLDGLGAMAPIVHKYGLDLVRPFLSATKQQLRDFLRSIKVSDWVEDPSNENPQFERVQWREKRQNLEGLGLTYDQLGKSQHRLARARAALQIISSRWWEENAQLSPFGFIELPSDTLWLEPEEIQLRILQTALQVVRRQDYVSLSQLEALLIQLQNHNGAGQSVLGGVVFQIKPRKGESQGKILICAEPGRTKPDKRFVRLGDQFVWDDRFDIHIKEGKQGASTSTAHFYIDVLGRENAQALNKKKLLPAHIPQNAAAVLAALYEEERLLMVPQLDLDLRDQKDKALGPVLEDVQIYFPRNKGADLEKCKDFEPI